MRCRKYRGRSGRLWRVSRKRRETRCNRIQNPNTGWQTSSIYTDKTAGTTWNLCLYDLTMFFEHLGIYLKQAWETKIKIQNKPRQRQRESERKMRSLHWRGDWKLSLHSRDPYERNACEAETENPLKAKPFALLRLQCKKHLISLILQHQHRQHMKFNG